MPNTEDIEAKLCAYVDGELDEAGRVEIERHLTTNPQHRKLIEELIEQRNLLRALPRARAPLDVAEMLNAQLERAALLNEEDDWRDQPIRLSRWPQIRAAAAVLLLVFGLAAVVYYIVPSPNRTNRPVVFNAPPSVERPRVADADVSPTTRPDVIPNSVVTVGEGKPDHEFMVSSEQQRRALLALLPDALRDTPISNAQSPQLQVMENAFASSPSARSRGQVKVVVAAADAHDAQRRVREYFNERGVELEQPFAQVAMPQPLSIDLTQRALGARQQQPTQIKLRERVKDDSAAAAQAAEMDAAQAAPAPGGAAGAGDAAREAQDLSSEPAQEQTFLTRLPRGEVAAMCQGISNQFAGRTAQVLEETPGDAPQPTESPDFALVEIGNWNSLFPWLAKSQAADAPHERRFAFVVPTTQPNADEEVDVLIVVRTDPALQSQQAQQALTDTAASGGAARAVQPTTAPTTGPSSP
jgi:anti-sigma factor RsiW